MRVFFCIVLFFGFYACGPDLPDRSILIQEMYDERKRHLFDLKDDECRERALEDAEAYVDSLIDRWINADLMDTLVFPTKPVKPDAPDHIIGTVKRFDRDSLN